MLQKVAALVPITTLLIIFLFVCGSLYLIGFWGTFDVDIANIVSFTDIPKSFLMPFAVSNGMAIINLLANLVIAKHAKEESDYELNNPVPQSRSKKVLAFFFGSDFIFSISVSVVGVLYYSEKSNKVYWVVSAYVLSILLGLVLQKREIIKKAIPYRFLRVYLICFLVYTPVMSFAIGKARALNIYDNEDVRYITAIATKSMTITSAINDTSSLKLLGFLGSKIIVSSLDNSKILILSQSTFSIVELVNRGEKKGEVGGNAKAVKH